MSLDKEIDDYLDGNDFLKADFPLAASLLSRASERLKQRRLARLIIDDCHDCGDWLPADSYGIGTICDGLSDHPIVPSIGEITPIPDWCPRLKQSMVEDKKINEIS